jgi:hypothetical protein
MGWTLDARVHGCIERWRRRWSATVSVDLKRGAGASAAAPFGERLTRCVGTRQRVLDGIASSVNLHSTATHAAGGGGVGHAFAAGMASVQGIRFRSASVQQ